MIDGLKTLFGSKTAGGPIIIQKQLDGRTRVLMRVSNNFKDRHDEIITSRAHQEYEAYVKESQRYPEFWLWHTKGSRWGIADLVSYDDGFLTVSGLVDVGKEYIAEQLAELGQDIGVSHGFRGIKALGEGYIDWYRMFEASPLPRAEAANVWTAYMLAKEWEMGLADKHKKFFETLHIPDSVVQGWDKESKDLATVLKEAGIEYKEVETPTGTTETPAIVPSVPVANTQEPSLSDVLAAVNKLTVQVNSMEEKQAAYSKSLDDAVADKIGAAIANGKGFVASKQGEAPSEEETTALNSSKGDDILTDLILGTAPAGVH